MSKKLYEENNIRNIANAIRTVNGSTDKYTVAQFSGKILELSLPGDGNESHLQDVTYIENKDNNGETFLYNVVEYNSNTDEIEASFNLSNCSSTNENIFSIGNDISEWGSNPVCHIYYTKSTNKIIINANKGYSDTSNIEDTSTYISTSDYNLLIKINKNGLYINGILITGDGVEDKISSINNLSTFEIGSVEGANRSKAYINYIKLKRGGNTSTELTLQEKSVIITQNGTTNVIADSGYDGLSKVIVNTDLQIKKYYTGSSEPSSSLGNDGDLYLKV